MVTVYYNSPGPLGNRWGSGMLRMRREDIGQWIVEMTANGSPILITSIEEK